MKTKLLYAVAAVMIAALLAVAGCSNPLTGGSNTNGRQAAAALTDSGSLTALANGPVEIVLLAGQDQDAGRVNVTNDSENLYVEFLPSEPWCIIETHVHVANKLDGFPLVGRWQTPAPGQFDFKTEHNCEPPYEYTIALGDLDVKEDLIIAAHAKLSDGEVTETAWAAGDRFADQGNWATFFKYSWTFMLGLDVDPEGKGSVTGEGRYPAGAEVPLSATPIEHWQFVNWTDENGDQISDQWEFVHAMPAQDQTLTANFEQILYELTLVVEPPEAGEVSGTGFYAFEEEIELTATTSDGYVFVKWVDEDGETVSVAPDFWFPMPGTDTTLTASFMEEPTEPVEIQMVSVPSGTFQRDYDPDDTTTVSAFFMSKHPITQAQYVAVTEKANPSYFSSGADAPNRPVERVSWYDALVFCNMLSMAEGRTPVYTISGSTNPAEWGAVPTGYSGTWNLATMNMDANGYRLPTEAEWMWAAMGATLDSRDGAFDGEGINRTGYLKLFAGDDGTNSIGGYAWYEANSEGTTRPVGTRLPNELELYDMSGNVLEWTWDWYASYPSGPLEDPRGSWGVNRVLRGGSWNRSAFLCSVAWRSSFFVFSRLDSFGFRVVSR